MRKAAEIPIRVTTTGFPLESAVDALRAMARSELAGAAVLKLE